MSKFLDALQGFSGVTIHEARLITPSLARVTATVMGELSDKTSLVEAFSKQLKGTASVVRDSFRFLDNKTVVGFLHASREVVPVDDTVKAKFRLVAANMFMDKEDESLWEMKEGAAGKYLARQGHDDLSALLESARTSPRGSTPRLSAVANAAVEPNEMVAFVNATKWSAEVDYGFCTQTNDDGSFRVLSYLTKEVLDVHPDYLVASYEIDRADLPKIAKSRISAANGVDPLASEQPLSNKALNWEEYYKLAYCYAPEYVDKVIDQIRKMSAV